MIGLLRKPFVRLKKGHLSAFVVKAICLLDILVNRVMARVKPGSHHRGFGNEGLIDGKEFFIFPFKGKEVAFSAM